MAKTRNLDGAFLGAVLNDESEFVGFYAMAQDATYVRGGGAWIKATGPVLTKLHGSQVIEMEQSFIEAFDKIDAKEETPTEAQIKKNSTKGNKASWDSQQKSIRAAEIADAGGE